MTRSSVWRCAALGAAAGTLYFLSFPPYSIAVLGWAALVPLVWAVRTARRAREAALAGAVAGLVACAGGYFWIADMAHRFWSVPWVFASFLLAVFGTFGEINFTLFALAAYLLRRRLAVWPAAATAALFAACEFVVPKVFPDVLSHSQIDLPALPFAAALVGAHGLSFAVAWAACAVAWLVERERRSLRQRLAEIVLCAASIAALAGWGVRREARLAAQPPERWLDVAIVQSNLGDPEEVAAQLGSVTAAIDSTVTLYLDLTRRALAHDPPDLVVWPETAVPTVPRPRVLERLQEIAAELRAPLVFGAYDSERGPGNRYRLYNAAFLLLPTGELQQRYYKHKLLLFGEYVPLSDRFPRLLDLLPAPGEFTPGPGPGVFRLDGIAMTPLICYELLFPRIVRQSLHAGGEIVLNLTNDYWFGRQAEPVQHLALSRMRVFETGRPIVRATNTGISALVDGRGRVVQQTGVWVQDVLRGTLPVPPMEMTPYVRWGDALAGLLAALAVAGVAAAWKLVR